MPTQKKPTKFKNVLESLDEFKIEHNFQYTKKEAKGSITGFTCTVIWYIIIWGYFIERCSLFWTHKEDSQTSF